MRHAIVFFVLFAAMFGARSAEEKIRGILEKTSKGGACAQITDALSEIYYINKTDDAEKAIEKFVGKNERVLISGTVESKEGDPSYFFALKSVEPYTPKLPPAPPAVAAPAAPAPVEPVAPLQPPAPK